MLPALPKSFGILRDVFVSALGSITGHDNRLNLKSTSRSICILVDGLGSANIKTAAGHAPFLSQSLAKNASIACGFPSTTAASITSFATGLDAAEHGFVGYRVLDRENDLDLNLLTGWTSEIRGDRWQTKTTVSEKGVAAGVPVFVIGPSEYQQSGFTMATMRSAKYLPARTIADRFAAAERLLRDQSKALAYLYIPELDQAAHAYGTSSPRWLELIEELDSQVRQFTARLPKNTGVLLTADHGIVDVQHHRQRYLDESALNNYSVRLVGGDPRVVYIYFDGEPEKRVAEAAEVLKTWIGDDAWVLNRKQLVEHFFAAATPQAVDRLPDLAMLCRTDIAIYHRGFAKAKSMQMIGQHGSISAKELNVPLLKLGDYA